MELKACKNCGSEFPTERYQFIVKKTGQVCMRHECPTCRNRKIEAKRRENPETIRIRRLRRKFGISLEDYLEILTIQDSKCAICKDHIDLLDRNLAVDHCHSSGKVRGLLCSSCNLGLGNFKDNLVFLDNAIYYLSIGLEIPSSIQEKFRYRGGVK